MKQGPLHGRPAGSVGGNGGHQELIQSEDRECPCGERPRHVTSVCLHSLGLLSLWHGEVSCWAATCTQARPLLRCPFADVASLFFLKFWRQTFSFVWSQQVEQMQFSLHTQSVWTSVFVSTGQQVSLLPWCMHLGSQGCTALVKLAATTRPVGLGQKQSQQELLPV
jgi:hypothetical protein